MPSEGAGPWANLELARSFLASLFNSVDGPAPAFFNADLEELSRWLIQAGLGPLSYERHKENSPHLAGLLKPDYYVTAVENSVLLGHLAKIASLFTRATIPFAMLKGAALSQTVYAAHMRPMSDIDLWVQPQNMPAAASIMSDAGYINADTPHRPVRLQHLSDGELRFVSPDQQLIELHWSPFSGWWLKRTARVDTNAIWQRTRRSMLPVANKRRGEESIGDSEEQWAHVLEPEYTILHLAVHTAVNHQFGMWAIRSIVDVTMVIQKETIDWQELVRRAYQWRLSTVMWLVLALQDSLIGGQGLETVLGALRPPRWKVWLLGRLISPQALLAGRDLRRSHLRFILLLLLTDRLRDAVRLVLRTLWPERSWLEARYGTSDFSHRQHLWNLLRNRAV